MGPTGGIGLQLHVPPLAWPRRLVAAASLLIFTLIPSLFFYAGLLPRGPAVMTHVFNVAVADFGEQSGEGQPIRESADARWMSDRLYEKLEPSLKSYTELSDTVEVEHAHIGLIRGATRAEREVEVRALAKRINATVVIYGVLDTSHPLVKLVPEFYVTEQFSGAEELTGENALGRPITVTLPLDNALNRLALNSELEPRTEGFSLFIAAMAYFLIGAPDKTLQYLDKAEQVPGWDRQQGKEVLYLLRGYALTRRGNPDDFANAKTAYDEALRLTNGEYARAYLGMGNMYLRQGTERRRPDGSIQMFVDTSLVDKAIAQYKLAIDKDSQARQQQGASYIDTHLDVKGLYDLGLAYTFEARVSGKDCPDPDAQNTLKKTTAAFEGQSDVGVVKEPGAKAYYQLGLLYETCGDQLLASGRRTEAAEMYRSASVNYARSREISQPDTIIREGWLGSPIGATSVKSEQGWQQLRWTASHRQAITCFQRAALGELDQYEVAVKIEQEVTLLYAAGNTSIPSSVASEANYDLGFAQQHLGRDAEAIQAYRRVLEIEPAGSALRTKAEARLAELGQP